MPFVFEQPNLGKPDENHLYLDPGDGRLRVLPPGTALICPRTALSGRGDLPFNRAP